MARALVSCPTWPGVQPLSTFPGCLWGHLGPAPRSCVATCFTSLVGVFVGTWLFSQHRQQVSSPVGLARVSGSHPPPHHAQA